MGRFFTGIATLAFVAACGSSTDVDPAAAGALAWITDNATPLASIDPVPASSDLSPFVAMAGDARVIGLGEGTHGSHEFFALKDRLLRHLVEDAGVTGFAIEASMPDAFAIDTYVRTGVGDPAVLLSHLYFWQWNTREVADVIAWLRQWNEQHPAKPVGFYGFDVQFPSAAMDSVEHYAARTDSALLANVESSYACLEDYRNDSEGKFAKAYSSAGDAVWENCHTAVTAVPFMLQQSPGPSARELALAVQMARVVIQWEALMESRRADVRDAAMADNVTWLLDREGPGGRLVLWAHDYHISRFPGSMGYDLANRLGTDYLPVGFSFGSGGLNAEEGLQSGQAGAVTVNEAPAPVADSFEALFASAPQPNYYFDMRQATGDAADWFSRGHRFRTIGLIYFPLAPESHYSTLVLPSNYDVMFFTRTITPSTLLPFQY
jgi:erythromycin esterase